MNDITNLIGTKYPVIQGALGHISTSELVIAVSEAGGLGTLTSVGFTKEDFREQIKKIKAGTDKPYAVNLMLQQDNIPDLVEVVLEEKPPVVTTGAGTPKHFLGHLKEEGIKVIPVVASIYHAQKMAKLGADAVIAEGQEAGGHIGQESTMVLLPSVVDAVDIPVIGAGGVFDHRTVQAMEALGAAGIQAGTLFLSAKETPIGQNYKNKLIETANGESIVTGRKSGHPVRNLSNDFLKDYKSKEYTDVPMEELEKLTIGSYPKAVFEDDMVNGSPNGGEVAGRIQEIRSAKEIIESLMNDHS